MVWWPRTAFREFVQQGGAWGLIPSAAGEHQGSDLILLAGEAGSWHGKPAPSPMPQLCCWSGGNLSICYRQRVRAIPWPCLLDIWPSDSLLPVEMPYWMCLCRTILRNRFGRRARGIKASVTRTSALCNAQWSTLCPVSQLPQEPVGKPTKTCVQSEVSALLCRVRRLESPSRWDALQCKASTQEEVSTFAILMVFHLAYPNFPPWRDIL